MNALGFRQFLTLIAAAFAAALPSYALISMVDPFESPTHCSIPCDLLAAVASVPRIH